MSTTPTTVFEMVSDNITAMSAVAATAITDAQAITAALIEALNVDIPFVDVEQSTFNPTDAVVSAEKPSPILDDVKDFLNLEDKMPDAPDDADKRIDWDEDEYTSTLKDKIRDVIKEWLDYGGTAIIPEVEDAIWQRQQERDEIALLEGIDDSLAELSALGFALPQGVDVAMVDEKQNAYTNLRYDRSREIAQKTAELEQQQRQFSVTAGTNLEQLNITEKSGRMERALKAATTIVDHAVQIFIADVNKFKALADVALGKVQALVSAYSADVQAYATEGNISGKNADLQLEEAKIIEMNAENNLRVTLQGAIANMQAYLQQSGVSIEAIKGIMGVLQSRANAAMQAIQTSAQLGASSRHDVGYSYSGPVRKTLYSTGADTSKPADAAVEPSI